MPVDCVTFHAIASDPNVIETYEWRKFKGGQVTSTGVNDSVLRISNFLNKNYEYLFTVTVMKTKGFYSTDTVQLTIHRYVENCNTSVDEILVSNNIHIFPNPAKDKFTLLFDNYNSEKKANLSILICKEKKFII